VKPSTVVVLGDLNGEVWATVPDVRFRQLSSDVLRYADVQFAVKGTAAGFALAAVDSFDRVHIIGRVGRDVLGELVEQELMASGIICHLVRDPVRSTGLAVALRDEDKHADRGLRVMVVKPNTANHGLEISDITECRGLLESADLLVADGYCMLEEPRRSSCLKAMEMARAAGTLVAFDLVPHDCYNRHSLDDMRVISRDVHVLIAEVRTLHGLLGVPNFERLYTRDDAIWALERLRSELGDRAYFVRFGVGNLEESLCTVPGRPAVYQRTGYREAEDPAGYGDRISASELFHHLDWLKKWSAAM
jgi:sugar/nucleoside kinase (ribokinase family)